MRINDLQKKKIALHTIFWMFYTAEKRNKHTEAHKMKSWNWLPPFMSLSSNSCIKFWRTISFYGCKCGNCLRWNVIKWLCVCWQDFHNEQVAVCLMCISHIWLEVTNLHCLSKLNRWLLILFMVAVNYHIHLFSGLVLCEAWEW